MADETTTATGTATETTDAGAAGAASTSGTSGASAGAGAAISLTREELDRQLAEARRTGERSARESDEIKQLRAAKKRLDDLEAASKTDLDRATERAAKAEAERDALSGRYRDALVRSEFNRLAADKGLTAQQVADAYALANRADITVDEDGTVAGVAAALDAVLKDRPYLAGNGQQQGSGQRTAPNINAGGRGGTPSREQQIEQARKELAQSGRYGRL